MLSREEAHQQNDAAEARERDAERLCAFEFLTRPDHEETCICEPPCSRDYDPRPYPEAEPASLRDYEGTGIGALYGLSMSASQAADLAGWNIRPGSKPE